MFYVKFNNPKKKLFEVLAGSPDKIDWLKDCAVEFRDAMNVSVKVVDDGNRVVAFFSRVI